MGFLGMLMQVIWVGVILSATMAAAAIAYSIALPKCPDRCGNVKIPYPYGTTEGCYLDDTAISGYYFINCTTNAYGQPQPMIGDFDVKSISIEEGEIEVRMDDSLDCYDKSGAPLEKNSPSFTIPSFTVSATKNKFVAVGCDTYAILTGIRNGQNFSVGCLSKCHTINSVVNGTCSGIGCCEVQIPEGMENVNFTANSFENNHTKVWDFNPCSYAFIIRVDKFKFSSDYLIGLQYNRTFPMVLDWAIGSETCEVAQNKANDLCGANTTCSNLKNQFGYRCKCKDGYEGNPYLSCQDIKECDAKELNNCTSHQYCVNEPGSYHCSCIEGYHLDGEACVPDQSSLAIKLTVVAGISLIAIVVVCSWLYFVIKKRRLVKLKEEYFRKNGGLILQQQLSSEEGSSETFKIFTAKELKKATNYYDESKIVGRGGYGTVYKGFLPNNRIVAIKKSKTVDENQIEQFINEVVVLSQINHRNVVKLLGCCLETQVPLLVYEYVHNGALFNHIHKESIASTISLSWETRLRIAVEIADALSYLHSAASVPIIHRDVKSTNILLDDDFISKVSDFGTSRLVPQDQKQLVTVVQGTLGYLDPEYIQTNQLTEKSDVYSFGVVLVELLTGQKALSFARPEEQRSLAMYFLYSLKENQLFEILENGIVEQSNMEQVKEFAKLAVKCLELKGDERPTMKEVAIELDGLRKMEKHPWDNVESNSVISDRTLE